MRFQGAVDNAMAQRQCCQRGQTGTASLLIDASAAGAGCGWYTVLYLACSYNYKVEDR